MKRMKLRLAMLGVLLSLSATPALAAPCTSAGTVDTPIAFPKKR